MVESSVSSINRSLPCWEIPVNIEVYSSTFFTNLEVLMIWLYSRVIVLDLLEEKTVNGFAWSPRLAPCKGIQVRNPGNFFACWIWNIGHFDGGIRDPRLFHGVESRIRDCLEFPYMGRQGDALTTDARRNWNSLMTLFYLFGQRY